MMASIVETLAAVLVLTIGSAAPALAADSRPTPAPAVQAVVDCRKIEDVARRVACYDATVETMAKAVTSGDLVTLDRQQRRAVREQVFGFALPGFSLFDAEKADALDKIDETLASASQDAQGRWMFRMRDGAVWRQTDEEFLSRGPHPGSAIVIRRATLGSFMLSVDGQPGVRARRDN
jgi:hypothetical protein